jgi:hypothetical protein
MKRIPVGKWSVSTVINDESYQSGTRQDSWHPGKATVSRAAVERRRKANKAFLSPLLFDPFQEQKRCFVYPSFQRLLYTKMEPCAAALPGPIRKAWAISTPPVDAAAAPGGSAHAHWPVAGWHVGSGWSAGMHLDSAGFLGTRTRPTCAPPLAATRFHRLIIRKRVVEWYGNPM